MNSLVGHFEARLKVKAITRLWAAVAPFPGVGSIASNRFSKLSRESSRGNALATYNTALISKIFPQEALTASRIIERPGPGSEIILSNDIFRSIFGPVVLILSLGIIQVLGVGSVSAPVESLFVLITDGTATGATLLFTWSGSVMAKSFYCEASQQDASQLNVET